VIAKGMGDEDEDADAHYDLGVAYKEMQLFDEAIREFELVRSQPGKAVQCSLMIGLCQAQRGRWDDAVKEFKRGLYITSITEREALALYYEIGASYEAMGDPREALYYFEKVQKRDPRFHDAPKRVDRLRATGARARPENGDDSIFEGKVSGH
jgi:pilus assembly protein FimV